MIIKKLLSNTYFPAVLFAVLYKMVLTFESLDEIVKCDHSNEQFGIEQYFPVVLFTLLYKVVLMFMSVDEILNVTIQMKAFEPYLPVMLLTVLYKVVLTFVSMDEILKYDHSNEIYWAVLPCDSPVYCAVQGGSNFKSVDEILKYDHSNESCCAVLSCGAIYCSVQSGSNFCVCGWPFKWKLLYSPSLWCCVLCCTRWF